MVLEFITVDHWDEGIWEVWCPIYEQAFGMKKGKQKEIIRNMFYKHQCYFHIGKEQSVVTAIALTGKLSNLPVLIIDYLAVSEGGRKKGFGQAFFQYIKDWAIEKGKFAGIVIEVEAEKTFENEERILFWIKCGFIKTEYIHHYKVVPEPYRAMYMKLKPDAIIPDLGEEWFQHIGHFHRQSFKGMKNRL
ncbi:GNAT family N-acetyltransferase [Niallia oryzisoli]|uniref:GNAT family N-acetyltransferase n=1 Tax=Niallia oryzisoli TaxID=1737571 RepID=UPI003734EF2A